VLDRLAALCDDVIAGKYDALRAPPFDAYKAHVSPNGSTVLAIAVSAKIRAALPTSHQWLDLFILEPHAQLGRHFHQHASAYIHFLSGRGVADIDGVLSEVAPGDEAFFPAGSIHNVRAGDNFVVFASFQDNPIIQADGSMDYFEAD
jgi:quercetin dioxygenase-like cupin family protein